MVRSALLVTVGCLAIASLMSVAAHGAALPIAPPASPDSIFEEALVNVYAHSPRLEAARADLKAVDEHVAQAISGFRPQIGANADIGRQREKIENQPWLYGQARDESLQLTQPLFNGFGTIAQMRAAKDRVKAGRARLKATEETVLLEAISAYMQVVSRHYLLQFTQDNANRINSYVSASHKRMGAGDATSTDVAQAEARFALAQSYVATATANWESARATYERIFGAAPQMEDFPSLPGGLPVSAEEAEVLARNASELAEAIAQEKAAGHDIDAAAAAFWPTVALHAGTSQQRAPDLGLQNLRDDSVTLSVSIPLYSGGADYARQREARELHAESVDNAHDAEQQAMERARQAWYGHDAAWHVLSSLRQNCEQSSRALNGFEIEQKQGMRSQYDTLEARADFFNALNAEVEAEENVRLQAYRVMAATGQLTAAHLRLPVDLYQPQAHYDKVEGEWF